MKMKNKKKKSYNPFKMWGSYVGLGIGIIFTFLPMLCGIEGCSTTSILYNIVRINNLWFGFPYILNPIIFFFIGYTIHSLIRKLRK